MQLSPNCQLPYSSFGDRYIVYDKSLINNNNNNESDGIIKSFPVLGKGCFGTVMSGTRRSDQKPVAVKMITLGVVEGLPRTVLGEIASMQLVLYTARKNMLKWEKSHQNISDKLVDGTCNRSDSNTDADSNKDIVHMWYIDSAAKNHHCIELLEVCSVSSCVAIVMAACHTDLHRLLTKGHSFVSSFHRQRINISEKQKTSSNDSDADAAIGHTHQDLCYNATNRLPLPLCAHLMRQLLLALHHCHDMVGIIHRDIKPSNLFLKERSIEDNSISDGVLFDLYLGDFGLSCPNRNWPGYRIAQREVCPQEHINEKDKHNWKLQQSTVSDDRCISMASRGCTGDMTHEVASRWYRAPELLLGCRHYGPEVDMWGAGCVLSEMIDGGCCPPLPTVGHRNIQKNSFKVYDVDEVPSGSCVLFPGEGDIDQLSKIFSIIGFPVVTTTMIDERGGGKCEDQHGMEYAKRQEGEVNNNNNVSMYISEGSVTKKAHMYSLLPPNYWPGVETMPDWGKIGFFSQYSNDDGDGVINSATTSAPTISNLKQIFMSEKCCGERHNSGEVCKDSASYINKNEDNADVKERLCHHNSCDLYQAVDLLEKLLVLDPQRRLTAVEALMHPFITRQLESTEAPF